MTVPESKDGRKISGPAVEDFLDLSPAKLFFESHDHHKTRNLDGTVRNVARDQARYYPLPLEEGKRMLNLLDFSAGAASVVDPCVSTGARSTK
jgi:hypothetical protein